MDIKTERRHYLNVPMVTRYVRIHPLTWRRRIGLRVGVLGCPHTGECGPGFLSVNSRSACGRFFIFWVFTDKSIDKFLETTVQNFMIFIVLYSKDY